MPRISRPIWYLRGGAFQQCKTVGVGTEQTEWRGILGIKLILLPILSVLVGLSGLESMWGLSVRFSKEGDDS